MSVVDCGSCEIGDQLAEGLKEIMFGLDLKKMVPGRSRPNSQRKIDDDKNNNKEKQQGSEGSSEEEGSDSGHDDDDHDHYSNNNDQNDNDRARLEALSSTPPNPPDIPSSNLTTFRGYKGNKNMSGRSPIRSPKKIYESSDSNPFEFVDEQDDKPPPASAGCDNNDVQDVDQMLAEMEIPDFNLSVNFEDFAVSAPNKDKRHNGKDGQVHRQPSIEDYTERMNREEVFSRRYHPSSNELKELQELATNLGMTSSLPTFSSTSASNLYRLLDGTHSIVLNRAPIGYNDRECELILLTDGFVLAYRDIGAFNFLGSRYETCHLWDSVDHVTTAKVGRLTISLEDRKEKDLDLVASSEGPNIRTWFSYIEKVLVSSVMNDPASKIPKDEIGWQYRVIHKPAYSAAVLGDLTLMGNPSDPTKDLNTTDDYNESTPLHYAMQANPCDAIIIEALLRYGADPNKPDGDGRTAMYFAQRNQLDDIELILKDFGGKASNLADMELRGELFAGVEEAQKRTEERREKEQAMKNQMAKETARKAESAQSQMVRNMAAMIERGEKIQEMDDKARQINSEAKDFGDMAKQLKNQMKNRKWYQL